MSTTFDGLQSSLSPRVPSPRLVLIVGTYALLPLLLSTSCDSATDIHPSQVSHYLGAALQRMTVTSCQRGRLDDHLRDVSRQVSPTTTLMATDRLKSSPESPDPEQGCIIQVPKQEQEHSRQEERVLRQEEQTTEAKYQLGDVCLILATLPMGARPRAWLKAEITQVMEPDPRRCTWWAYQVRVLFSAPLPEDGRVDNIAWSVPDSLCVLTVREVDIVRDYTPVWSTGRQIGEEARNQELHNQELHSQEVHAQDALKKEEQEDDCHADVLLGGVSRGGIMRGQTGTGDTQEGWIKEEMEMCGISQKEEPPESK